MTKIKVNDKSIKYEPYKGLKNDVVKVSSLDTLAQLVTSCANDAKKNDDIKLIPCTHEDDKETLQKRAYRKYISHALSLRLVDASKINPKSTLEKSYFNSYHCCSTIAIHSSGKVKGNYCKNRWCAVCNSIRTAVLIHTYMPIIEKWDDKYFVTLTLKNIKDRELRNTIYEMNKTTTKIKSTIRQRHVRGKGERYLGLRKLECTYNPNTDEYHPHFHFIINGYDNAHELYYRWIELTATAKYKGQDIKQADDNSTKELFKYFTKITTPIKDKKGNVIDHKIYADAMDVIFNSIKGMRTFQHFGFKQKKKVKAEDFAPLENSRDPVVSTAKWIQELADWAEDNGELLSGYIIKKETEKLVKNKIIVRDNFHTKQIKLCLK